MKSTRKLALRREVLADLESFQLSGLAAGAPAPPTRYCGLTETCFSCYTFVSCWIPACLTDRIPSLPECVNTD